MDAVFDREQMGDRFLGGGLAHRTGDADGCLAPQFSDSGGQSLKSDKSVVDGEQSLVIGIARELIFANDGGDRTAAQGGLYEVVAIETLALYREEKFAGLYGARIDGISLCDCARVVVAGGGDKFGDS